MNTAAVTLALSPEDEVLLGLVSVPIGIFLLGLPFVFLSSCRKKRHEAREEAARLRTRTTRRQRAESELREARLGGGIRPVEGALPVLLERGEITYWCEPSALSETRTERTFSGFTTDWQALEAFSLGTINAKENEKDVWKQIDAGHLVVTDRRILFVGTAEQRTVPFEKIVSLQGSPEALAVGSSDLAKKMFFTSRNGLLVEWTIKKLVSAQK